VPLAARAEFVVAVRGEAEVLGPVAPVNDEKGAVTALFSVTAPCLCLSLLGHWGPSQL